MSNEGNSKISVIAPHNQGKFDQTLPSAGEWDFQTFGIQYPRQWGMFYMGA